MADLHWMTARDYVIPLGISLALGVFAWGLFAWLERRSRGKDFRRARITRILSLPLAFVLPLIFLRAGLEATPLKDAQLQLVKQLLHIGIVACVTWLLVRVVAGIVAAILRDNRIDVADNLHARTIHTQARVLGRVASGAVILVGASVVLLQFDEVRQLGRTLLASAGILGLVAGIAAKPVFGNLIAGLQIALTQPIRLDDVVIVEGEWGRIEEITSSFVVVHIWDQRRMVVPLTWFIENPFQNWTRRSADMLGTVFLWLDYRTPMAAVRAETERVCREDPRWDGRVCIAQVTETSETAMQVRLLVSARSSGDAFDLRCVVRERVLDYLAREYPDALPRQRNMLTREQTPPDTPQVLPSARQTSSPGAEDGPPPVSPEPPGPVPPPSH
ncbi:mechanosensitive ion channel family protein [Pseudoxanthomonas winnipegensis]|uniref:mechanosensitive ion channel family protein n=1 Tax=Pseudoxanthomonas winnipegensis TaxID=2480810 RepID=UPI002578685C|nr:mechanosensitive ion channel family protein [Pseudoxanthomonas winnipegensis]WJI16732.1 mechanosensitive ion channel family protein [Pseudoxanthomonas winnipegensis]